MVAKAKKRSLRCHMTTLSPRGSRASVRTRFCGFQIATANGPRSIGQTASPNFSHALSRIRESGQDIASRGVKPILPSMSSRLSSRISAVIIDPLGPRYG